MCFQVITSIEGEPPTILRSTHPLIPNSAPLPFSLSPLLFFFHLSHNYISPPLALLPLLCPLGSLSFIEFSFFSRPSTFSLLPFVFFFFFLSLLVTLSLSLIGFSPLLSQLLSPMEVPATLEVPRRSTSSPEFEFWMVGNYPSTPQPNLLTADELFVDGVLLPLHLLSLPDPHPAPEPDPSPDPLPSASICCTAASPSASKRWKDIFKVGDKKPEDTKERRKDRKSSASGAAELNININIWPFLRSRSAGNGAARPRSAAAAARKISSAPCSRSNSRGESSKPAAAGCRKWAASPGRNNLSGGVHLGRASPVWQLRRPEKLAAKEKVSASSRKGSGPRISLNVNTCIGYRSQVSCRTDDGDGDGERAGGSGGLFSLRTLFTKKVY